MTDDQVKLQLKATALNAIRKIYDPFNYSKGVGLFSNIWSDPWGIQRDEKVKEIIDSLEAELNKLKINNKCQTK